MKLTYLSVILLLCMVITPPVCVKAQASSLIVIDMSHGQYSSYVFPNEDADLKGSLETNGYEVVFAFGGLNNSILADADGLLVASIFGLEHNFSIEEVQAVQNWYEQGEKFLWIGSDSDYNNDDYINENMNALLESVGSHVYAESLNVDDDESNCGSGYRVIANETSTDSYVSDVVAGIDAILMHGATCLYGSTSAEASHDTVALETQSIENVYPILFYSEAASLIDSGGTPGLAHSGGETGSFVATTFELGVGAIVVSGASPYGDYKPMYSDLYYGVTLDGPTFVLQMIEFGIEQAGLAGETTPTTTPSTTPSTTPTGGLPTSLSLETLVLVGGLGVVVVLAAVIAMRRR